METSFTANDHHKRMQLRKIKIDMKKMPYDDFCYKQIELCMLRQAEMQINDSSVS